MLGSIHRSNSRAAASPLILYRSTIATIALLNWRNKKVCSFDCVQRMHLEQILNCCQLLTHQEVHLYHAWRRSSFVQPGSSIPLILYRSTIAAIAVVYFKSKKVCSSDCVRRTHLKQIFVSSSPPMKCIGTIYGGVHRSNSRAATSQLILYRFTMATI